MRIKDIFKDKSIVEDALIASKRMRMASDVNAVGGAIFEQAICMSYNSRSSDYRLLTIRLIKSLATNCNYKFDFLPFATSFSDLEGKSKKDYGLLSAADLCLFKKISGVYVLVDFASLKSSIDPENPTSVYIHNDASNFIHESLRDGANLDRVIGNVIIAMLRGNDYRIYHFDKTLYSLHSKMALIGSNKHGDRDYGISSKKTIHSKNRAATTHKKQTSFNRGLLLFSRKSKKENEFDQAEELVSAGVFDRCTSGSIQTSQIFNSLVKEMNL